MKDISEFLWLKQGPMECALEKVVSVYQISTNHNPYYGRSFNGNDCFGMVENISSLFEPLLHAPDNNASEQAELMIKRHYEIWESVQ